MVDGAGLEVEIGLGKVDGERILCGERVLIALRRGERDQVTDEINCGEPDELPLSGRLLIALCRTAVVDASSVEVLENIENGPAILSYFKLDVDGSCVSIEFRFVVDFVHHDAAVAFELSHGVFEKLLRDEVPLDTRLVALSVLECLNRPAASFENGNADVFFTELLSRGKNVGVWHVGPFERYVRRRSIRIELREHLLDESLPFALVGPDITIS